MHLNWNKAKTKFQYLITQNGIDVQWLQRVVSGSGAYDTGSTTTYGYGDQTTYFVTGSLRAVMAHLSAQDIVLEPGFYMEDYDKLFIDPDSTVQVWDQLILPSGSGERYIVQSIHSWRADGNIVITKFINIRKLVPKSGSTY